MKNLSKLILFVCFGILFAACNNDNLDTTDPNGNGGSDFGSNGPKVTKTFSFSIPEMASAGLDISRAELEEDADEAISFGMQPATRATVAATAAEKTIKNLYIMQFDAAGKILGKGQSIPASDIKVDNTTGNASVDITIDEATGSKLYVFANCQPLNANTDTTEAKMKADSIQITTAITVDDLATKGLPMMGMATLSASASSINVPMSFLVAKISTKVSTSLPSGASFTLTGVGLVDVPKHIYITSGATTSTKGGYHSSYAFTTTNLTRTDPFVFYVPENKAGTVAGLTSKTKSWWDAPEHAMRLRINGTYKKNSSDAGVAVYYELYPGANSATDFNVARNTVYTINPTVKGTNVSSDLRVWANTLVNLNVKGTGSTDTSANCYIAYNSGTAYHFDATIKGNGKNRDGSAAAKHTPTSVEVLWETTSDQYIIRKVKLYGGHVYFLTAGSVGGDVRLGNALIAVKSGSNILWSWHIWSTGPISTESYKIRATGAGIPTTVKMMNRNLGAANNNPGDHNAFGLLYQWGRKDPFVGANGVSGSTYAESTMGQNWPVKASANTGADANASVDFAIKNPTTFITQINTTTYDWVNAPTVEKQLNNLWGNASTVTGSITCTPLNLNTNKGTKTMYDPCPIGYKVPPQYTWTNFTKDGNNHGETDKAQWNVSGTFDHGWKFYCAADGSGATTFYPAAGYRDRVGTGALLAVGAYGYVWSSSTFASGGIYAGSVDFRATWVSPLSANYRSNGFSVRCVQEF